MPAGGNPQQTYANISGSQWQDYVSQFVPLENQMIKYATSQNTVPDAMKTAGGIADQASSQIAGEQQRRLAQYGVKLNPEEQMAADRTAALTKVGANVTAQNTAKDQTVANQMGILGLPMTGVT